MTTRAEHRVIGKPLPKVAGEVFVTGEAQYGADVYLPGMLYGKILRAPVAHGRIRAIRTERAAALPGVGAIVTGQDFPQLAPGTTFSLGEFPVDLAGIAALVMARDKVLCHSHPVAAVAAVDPYVAEEALGLIEVEYEELLPVLDLEAAMQEGAPLVHPDQFTMNLMQQQESERPSNVALHAFLGYGDVAQGFAQADVVIERTYRVAMAHQGYLEPQAATARVEPSGQIVVWTTTQGSFTVQIQIAGILKVPVSRVKVVPTEVGGAFGGKIYAIIEPVAVKLAEKAGRPVKVVLSREEVLRATGPGSPCVIRLKTGCTKEGLLTAVEGSFAFDAGCIPGAPVVPAMLCAPAPYRVDHLKLEGYDVVTNKPRVHAYRAPGAPQGSFAMEQNVDLMAAAVGMDPLAFRRKNVAQEGDRQATGLPFGPIGMKAILERIAEHPHWQSPLQGPNRGRGLACGFWPGAQFTSGATLSLHPDGKASLVVGSVDLTGTRTAMAQVVAEELGLDPSQVYVTVGDTETAPYTDVTGGSRTAYTMATAVHRACQDVLAQARDRAAARLEAGPGDLEFDQGVFRVRGSLEKAVPLAGLLRQGDGSLVGRGSVSALKPSPAFGAHVTDVAVDPETGQTRVLRYTAFQDVGVALNPIRIEAQMQAGVLQGLGWALTEELLFDEGGVLRNPSLLDYRQPTAMDVPMIACEIIQVPNDDGAYGVRGVGEVPIVPPLAAVANAVARAVDGVRTYAAPITPERLHKALKERGQ